MWFSTSSKKTYHLFLFLWFTRFFCKYGISFKSTQNFIQSFLKLCFIFQSLSLYVKAHNMLYIEASAT